MSVLRILLIDGFNLKIIIKTYIFIFKTKAIYCPVLIFWKLVFQN